MIVHEIFYYIWKIMRVCVEHNKKNDLWLTVFHSYGRELQILITILIIGKPGRESDSI